MKKLSIVFKYKIWFEGDDFDQYQFRFVSANTEEEAEEKLNKYRKELIKNGFADFKYCDPVVEIEGLII